MYPNCYYVGKIWRDGQICHADDSLTPGIFEISLGILNFNPTKQNTR